MDEENIIQRSLLSDKAIMRHMKLGTVIIEPFEPSNLSTSSYDVTLGQYYFREQLPEPGMGIFNPFSESNVHRVWGKVMEAELVSNWTKRTGITLENIR
jgi:hypothetical protein